MVGEGVAELPSVIANLRTIGYKGPLSLELFNRSLRERDTFEVVKVGLERIKGLVEGSDLPEMGRGMANGQGPTAADDIQYMGAPLH